MRSFEHEYLLEQPISHSQLTMVRVIGEHKGKQTLYQRQIPQFLENLTLSAKVESVESSNRIEGITAERRRISDIVLHESTPQDRSEQEIAGYRDALSQIHANAQSLVLETKLIKQLHRVMFSHTALPKGEWKEKDNAIWEVQPDGRRVIRFQPVSAVGTAAFMGSLCEQYHSYIDRKQTDPLLTIAAFILDFSCIHPFWDGNGRMSRLLTLMLLYQNGYEVGRFISLERLIESSKDSYYEALHQSSQGWHDARHDLRPWWNYFLGTLLAAYGEFEKRIGTLQSQKGAKQNIVSNALTRLPNEFRIEDLRSTCPGVSFQTIRLVLQDWKNRGWLVCHGSGKAARWRKIPNADQA
ncbi:MAG: Fic family protein [Candidatus Omnitrophica bacterium]|nr:MAG: Fic/DOC family protein [Candidatus Hinthialibacteria bacterium OLB16]MCK6496226.1 Fic family protein [bacterium]MCL4734826.1 Fic family protein [Candidatus Omnitrophota bacterium]